MKPHDKWNSADIADHARRAPDIVRAEEWMTAKVRQRENLGRMSMHVTEYDDEPEPLDLTRTRLFIALQLVCIAALLVAIVYSAWRIF